MIEFHITEPGFYKQRDGGRAEIVGKCSLGSWVGINSAGEGSDWTCRGTLISQYGQLDRRDLIAPWTEPKKVMLDCWINMYLDEDGFVFTAVYSSKENADTAAADRFACIHIQREVTEGEGL
jgi:hypothetical protein